MSANNNAGSKQKRPCLGDDAANFVYTNLEDHVPDGVIHVRVHPSIKVIPARAFSGCSGLMDQIILPDVLSFLRGDGHELANE